MEHMLERGVGVLGPEHGRALHRRELAVNARHRGRGHLHVKVGAFTLDHVPKRSVDVERHRLRYRVVRRSALAFTR